MSVWSGLAAGGFGIALVALAAGMPIWDYRIDDSTMREEWSYRPFSAYHYLFNETTQETEELRNYSYAELATVQGNMSSALSHYQLYVTLGIVAAIVGVGLSAVTRWKGLRGIFAGLAFAGASASILYASFNVLFAIPPAAARDIEPMIVALGGRSLDGSTIWGPAMGLFLPIGSGLAFAWASSDLWHLRPAKKPRPKGAESTAKPEPPATVVALPPPPVETVPSPVEPQIEEVFLIGSNGILIKHMARSLMTDKDRDIVGGMISAISSFVREAFTERDGEVHEVRLGEHRFIMCNERGVVVAVLVTAGETEALVPRLRHLLTLLLDRYGEQLTTWHGKPLPGIEDELHVLWEPFQLPPPPAE